MTPETENRKQYVTDAAAFAIRPCVRYSGSPSRSHTNSNQTRRPMPS